MKPEIISRETIKPTSPTPDSKRIYKLSLLDQLTSGVYVPIIFFYRNNNSVDLAHTSTELKKSLSETLTHYYPVAGKIKDGATIECNDQGVSFSETRVESHLEEFLKHHDLIRNIDLLMPDEIHTNGWDKCSLLLIQITFFGCGGIAIGMLMAHMLADITGISSFINDWAIWTTKSGKQIHAELTRFFPPSDSVSMPEALTFKGKGNLVKKFVFDSKNLDKLKTMAIRSGVENPTRVQVVTALIYRSAIAASKWTSGSLKPSLLNQVVNLRKMIKPPLPEKSFGNMAWFYTIKTQAQESELELSALVGQLKAGLSDFYHTYGEKNFTGEELMQLLWEDVKSRFDDDDNVNKYTCSSWCRSSLYEADFGWGRPIWLGHAGIGSKNFICLNDSREGNGIEAFVTLEEQEMAVFERDEELLQFCYLG